MCVGIPMRITSVDGAMAMATDGHRSQPVDLSLIGPVAPGDWVLTHLDAAREILTPESAAKITAAVDALRSIMAGGDAGDAFADLEEAGPRLPPHLQQQFDDQTKRA